MTKPDSHARHLYSIAFLLGILLITSCSGPQIREDATHFHTRITSKGLKHFQLSVILPPERRSTNNKRRNEANSRYSPEERAARRAEKILKQLVEVKIQETQFCRKGYWFLGERFYGRKIYIRGECNDIATEADRENFPDTIHYW